MVFHDVALERLIDSRDALAAHDAAALKRFTFRDGASRMLELGELLELVGGREPMLVEIKSEWDAADPRFLANLAKTAAAYRGPIGLMSFDPAVIVAIKELAPEVPRGIVSGLFEGRRLVARQARSGARLRLEPLP